MAGKIKKSPAKKLVAKKSKPRVRSEVIKAKVTKSRVTKSRVTKVKAVKKPASKIGNVRDVNVKKMEKTMNQSKIQFDAFSSDAAKASRESIEAVIKSGTIFAKGIESVMRTTASLAQNAAEKQAQYIKEAMSSKNINEWSEVQSKIAQSNFDDFVAGTTKISEMSIKVLTEASEPVNNQVNEAVKKATKRAAA